MISSSSHTKSVIILHRVPYHKINYHEIIDHDVNDVYYVVNGSSNDVPADVRHTVISVPEDDYIQGTICAIMLRDIKVDFVIALSEYHLIPAELIRSALGLKAGYAAQQLQSVYNCRDKALMKKCVNRVGILVARSKVISERDSACFLPKASKFIVKPTRGASSENIRLYESTDDLRADADLQLSFDKNESFLIEEFIEGDIYHFDGLVFNGEILLAVGSIYIGNCLEFSSGTPLASVQLDDVDAHLGWISRCIAAVGIRQGAFHLEGILSDQGMVFLEVGNRAGGAGVVNCTEKAFGINLMQEEVKMTLSPASYTPPQSQRSTHCFGWFVVPAASFRLCESSKSLMENVPEIVDLTLNHTPHTSNGVSYAEDYNPCTGIVAADNHEEAVEVMRFILERTSLAA